MDAHSRGGAEGIDPADQWVLNPQTGNYELRLDDSTGKSPAPAPSRSTAPPPPRKRRSTREPSPSAAGPADTPREAPTGSRRRTSRQPSPSAAGPGRRVP
ncbi:hypothetical protein LUX12_03195 [Streptomyces somaliensis]|uniref:hypothetical protein n=1 Tax=Streptomyces somaliensis TaxID=78355 RepID=UPI0020CBE900|nr:hypothetical protein [Streptomyces somaliensis]MCP9944016.1 hypothetical protein [Streptomyces somaliensis]